jgi:hypothetical protein
MKHRLVTENQLLRKNRFPLAAVGNPRRAGNKYCDTWDSAPATAAADIISREDVCAECSRFLIEASAIPGSRDVLSREGS